MMKKTREMKRISDDAVSAETGKTWADWFSILDAAGAKKWPHKEIANHLYEKEHVRGWWSQMVAVAYEQERGLRQPGQSAEGFSVSASRTMAVAMAPLLKAWSDEKARRKWLPDATLEISKATAGKSLRAAWNGGASRVEILFYKKGPRKSQVAVDHRKLKNAKESARMKTYWFEALNRLQELLEA
ncbi:MAG: hypothetical protein ACRD4K_06685, partial [Candidatus Acidiferrales bacterium]